MHDMDETLAAEGLAAFAKHLPGVATYPLRGFGAYIILGGALFFAVCTWIATLSGFGMLLIFGIGGYQLCYAFEVLARTAGGETTPPDWPAFNNFREEILKPLILGGGAVIISLLPYIALRYWMYFKNVESTGLLDILLYIGLAYLPMAMISVVLHDGLSGVWPGYVLPAIAKTFPSYVLILLCIGLCAAISWAVGLLIHAIPILSSFLNWLVFLYLTMAVMHVLGLLYRTHTRRIGWFD